MHARETLFLLVKHHIGVPSECQTVWFQFTVQVRSLLGLIWVQTVAMTTDKDLNISFCKHSIYFQKIINCTCTYVYAANRFFRHFHNLWCDEQRLWWTAYTHMLQVCVKPKRLSNLLKNLSRNPWFCDRTYTCDRSLIACFVFLWNFHLAEASQLYWVFL